MNDVMNTDDVLTVSHMLNSRTLSQQSIMNHRTTNERPKEELGRLLKDDIAVAAGTSTASPSASRSASEWLSETVFE